MANIYALVDPRTDEIRYVGKTEKTLLHRLNGHMEDVKYKRSYCHRTNWIRQLVDGNLKPSIILLEKVPDEDWQWYEIWWIVWGRLADWQLTNTTNGGRGSSGWCHTEESKMKISEALRGEKHPNYGKHHSRETKEKQSSAKKGKYIGERNPMYGRHHSEAAKKKQSDLKTGKYLGERNPNSRLSELDVREIRRLLNLGVSWGRLARQFGVGKTTIGRIKSGSSWRGLS